MIGESELLCRCGTIYNVQSILMSLSPHRGCGAYSRAALINFFVPDAALIRGRLDYIRYLQARRAQAQARRVHGFPDSVVLFNLICNEVDVLVLYLSFEIR